MEPCSRRAATEPVRISKTLEMAAFAVAPDGSRIAYTRVQEHSNLWLIPLTRKGAEITATSKPLTRGRFKTKGLGLSPDGKTVAFSQTALASNVFTLSLPEGSPKQLTEWQAENEPVLSTSWSPDGSEIVLAKHTSGGGAVKLFRVAAGGGEARLVQSGPISETGFVAWSPGKRILYQVPGNQNFMLLDPSPGNEQPLIREQTGWPFEPRYSPDGSKLALYWNQTKNYGLYVFSLDDQSSRLLRQGEITPVGWSADGRNVYALEPAFSPNPNQPQKLLIVPLEGGEPTTVGLPFEPSLQFIEDAVFVPSIDGFVCIVSGAESDIWIADGFAPHGASP